MNFVNLENKLANLNILNFCKHTTAHKAYKFPSQSALAGAHAPASALVSAPTATSTSTPTLHSTTASIISSSFYFAVACSALVLAGCATKPTAIITPPVETRVVIEPAAKAPSEQLLNYLLEARAMSPGDLSGEKERTRAELARSKTEYNRMKLAILIAIAPMVNATNTAVAGPQSVVVSTPVVAPFVAPTGADDAELASLLDPLVTNTNTSVNTNGNTNGNIDNIPTSPDIRALAILIQGLVQDRKKMRDQLKDSQARTQVTRRDELTSQTEARILRGKVEELEKKLDALKSIERSVSGKSDARNNAPPPRTEGTPPK